MMQFGREHAPGTVGALVEHAAQFGQRPAAEWIIGGDSRCSFELLDRPPDHSFGRVDTAEVHKWEMTWFVAWRLLGLLEPAHRLVEFTLGHQVRTDIVVRIAKVGIDCDRLMAFSDGVVGSAHMTIGPAAKRIRLSGRQQLDGPGVKLHRSLQVAVHVRPVTFLPERYCARSEPLVLHGSSVNALRKIRQEEKRRPQHSMVSFQLPPGSVRAGFYPDC